jgi:hypothetical protein
MARYAITHVKVGSDGELEDVCVCNYEMQDGVISISAHNGKTVDALINGLVCGDTAFVNVWDDVTGGYVERDRVVVIALPGGREVLRSVSRDGQFSDLLVSLPKLN